MQTSLSQLGAMNVELAKNAAYLEAGRIVSRKLTALAASKAPMMIKGYLDTALGRLLVSNALLVASNEVPVLRTKPIVQKLAQAAVAASYVEVLQSFDIEGMVDGILNDPKIAGVAASLGE